MAEKVISSWVELQNDISNILDKVNADSNLALAAAVNPLLALKEMGYKIVSDAVYEIEDRLRFSPKNAVLRRQLRIKIYEISGYSFDINSEQQLHNLLFDKLKLVLPPTESGCTPTCVSTRPLPPQLKRNKYFEDPLTALSGMHHVIEPILEYRRMEASVPYFADGESYNKVREGKRNFGISKIRARLKNKNNTKNSKEGSKPSGATTDTNNLLININTANAIDFIPLLGIGPELAKQIVTYRNNHGAFSSIDDIKKVSGIGYSLFSRIKSYITV